jgi:hypothetical protein
MTKQDKQILYLALAFILALLLVSVFDVSVSVFEDFSFKLTGCIPFGPCN